jgi:hypothetical protein
MLAIIALCAGGIALAASAVCAWFMWIRSTTAHGLVKEASRVAQEALSLAKEASRVAQEASRTAAEASSLANDASRMARMASSSTGEASSLAQDASRISNDASRMAELASAAAKEASASAAGAAASANEATRSADEAARIRELTAQTLNAQADALREESRENRDALQIAERSARAAEESARATRILAESGQRAYVALGAVQIVRSDLGAGFPTAVRCEARNSGKTPAFSAVSCQWLAALNELPPDPDYTGIDSISAGDLGPGGVSVIDANTPAFDALVTQALRNRELTVFLYGLSRYKDVFGMARQTRWAFFWNAEKRQFTRCAHHNDMT